MIVNFKSKLAYDIYHSIHSRYALSFSKELHRKTQRLFDQLNAATQIDTLRVPPSNRLEKLSGKFKEYWSLRINDQWRVIFRWEDLNALDVDIVDYH